MRHRFGPFLVRNANVVPRTRGGVTVPFLVPMHAVCRVSRPIHVFRSVASHDARTGLSHKLDARLDFVFLTWA